MSKVLLSSLQKHARVLGIQPSYIDALGREHFASEETLRALIEKLEGDTETEQRHALLDPVVVAWDGKSPHVRLGRRSRVTLELEDGTTREFSEGKLRTAREENEFALDLPPLPNGYHTLSVAGDVGKTLVISAPRKLYTRKEKQWGGFLPLYSVHSSQSWGAGNLSDWQNLAVLLSDQGARVIGTLPLLAAFLEKPFCEPSPYSPASRLFWNEFFIDVLKIPEFSVSARSRALFRSVAFQRKLNAFRESELIDYKEQWALRRRVLEILTREFFSGPSPRQKQFRAWVKTRPELQDYARFRAACDWTGKSWPHWPARSKNGRLSKAEYSPNGREFYLYVQWIAQEQMDELLRVCRERAINFYLDLPLGVNPDGYDAWKYREFFAPQVSAGAPPDAFFTKGQDWGFAPLCPRRARSLHYRYVIEYLRFQMRHTGLLRIDHVMGLHRLWWVPHGFPPSAGAYVRYAADELYAILSVESHRHKTMLVGENLGTVPPEVNKSMDRHGLRRMYVVQYEQLPNGPLRRPPKQVVASINTHDMPAFAAHWKGLDIEDRHSLGLISAKEVSSEQKKRATLRKNLMRFLRREKLLREKRAEPRDVLAAILEFLARSDAETVLVNLEDLWCEERPQNVPGTSRERPNWRRKSALPLEQIQRDPDVAEILARINKARAPFKAAADGTRHPR